jgi:hypothetical protein
MVAALGEAGLVNLQAPASDFAKAIGSLKASYDEDPEGQLPDDGEALGYWYTFFGTSYALIVHAPDPPPLT